MENSKKNKYIRISSRIKETYLTINKYDFKGELLSVYVVLCYHMDKKGVCYPSQRLIAAEAGISINKVKKLTDELEKFKFIKKNKEYKYTGDFLSEYDFFIPKSIVESGTWRELSNTDKKVYIAMLARSYDMHYFFYDELNDFYPYKYDGDSRIYVVYGNMEVTKEEAVNYKFVPLYKNWNNREICKCLKIKERIFYASLDKLRLLKLVYKARVYAMDSDYGEEGYEGFVIPVNVPDHPKGEKYIQGVKNELVKARQSKWHDAGDVTQSHVTSHNVTESHAESQAAMPRQNQGNTKAMPRQHDATQDDAEKACEDISLEMWQSWLDAGREAFSQTETLGNAETSETYSTLFTSMKQVESNAE